MPPPSSHAVRGPRRTLTIHARRARVRARSGAFVSTSALVVIPPFLKIAYGPLLGPAMLLGAGRDAGHDVRLLDLNASWIRERLPDAVVAAPRHFIGDHDRPPALAAMHRDFLRELALVDPRQTHDAVIGAATRLVSEAFGAWVRPEIANVPRRPDVFGVSLMYREQVEPALAISMIARQRWPYALIVWGGAHVTALREEISSDRRYAGDGLIDGFVFGYAERTWTELLDAVADGTAIPNEIVEAGSGPWRAALDDGAVVPVFDDVAAYDSRRLTLPIQSSRGCTYGKCAYCTYPVIEGAPRNLPWTAIDPVIEHAILRSAVLSFKDSLIDGDRLEALGNRVAGRTRWSACTKLDARLPGRLEHLAAGGCRTLEIGLETIDRHAQSVIMKRQNEATFYKLLDAAAASNIAIVANYITGLPNVDANEQARCRALVEAEMETRKPALVSKLEHNTFQLERLAPMGRNPERYGIRITHRAPWASVVTWESSAQLLTLGRTHSSTSANESGGH